MLTVGDKVATVAIAGMVLGGLGNVWGAIVGGLFVGVLEVLSIYLFGSSVEKVPIWGLLLLDPDHPANRAVRPLRDRQGQVLGWASSQRSWRSCAST